VPGAVGVSSLENDKDPIFQLPFSLIYTSVTIKRVVTSLPPTTANNVIRFNRIAVVPIIYLPSHHVYPPSLYHISSAFNDIDFLFFSPRSSHVNKHGFFREKGRLAYLHFCRPSTATFLLRD